MEASVWDSNIGYILQYYLGWPDPSCRGERFIWLEEKPDFQEYDWLFFLYGCIYVEWKISRWLLLAFHKELDNY